MKKLIALILACVLCAGFAACGIVSTTPPTTEAQPTESAGDTAPLVQFTFTVVDLEGKETVFEISTNETTVGAALMAQGLIAGEDGPYGLYVKTVNGTTLDYDKDGKYWAFYVNGEYGTTGVDVTDIVPGTTYTFKAE